MSGHFYLTKVHYDRDGCTPLIRQFGGKVLVLGPWKLLFGEAAYRNGIIIRFPDKDAALAWYNSPAYQALLEIRDVGLASRFRLVR